MNYKKITQIESFGIVAVLGIMIDHDSYQMFLAIASAIVAYFLVCIVWGNKGWRFLIFAPTSVTICQLSVTLKRAVTEEGFEQVLTENPIGFLFADVIYGFKHAAITVLKAFGGFTEAIVYDQYSSIEGLNYRFFTIIVMIVIMTIFILRKESLRKPVVKQD